MSGATETPLASVPSRPVPKRRWVRRFAWCLLALIGLIVLAMIAAWFWIGSQSGRSYVEARVEALAPAGQSIQIEGLDGSVLGAFEIDRLTIADKDGIWLTAEDVSVNWSPRPLIGRRLEVQLIEADRVTVDRRPNLTPSNASGANPIKSVEIDALSFPEIRLGEPVLSRALVLNASGQASHTETGGSAVLHLKSDQGDAVAADLSWSPDFLLRGDAEVIGPPGGLITKLLQVEDSRTVRAEITTEGDFTTLDASLDEAPFLSATIHRGDDRAKVEGRLDANILSLTRLIALAFGDRLDFTADYPFSETGSGAMSIQAPRLAMTSDFKRDGQAVEYSNLSAQMAEPITSIRAFANLPDALYTAASGRLSAAGEGRIAGGKMAFDGTVKGEGLGLKGHRIEALSGPVQFALDDDVITVTSDLSGPWKDGARVRAARLALDARFNRSSRAAEFDRLAISIPGLRLDGRGKAQMGDTLSANFDGRYTVDSALLRQGPAATFSGQVTSQMGSSGPRFSLTGDASSFRGMPDAVQPILESPLSYSLAGGLNNGSLNFNQFNIQGPDLRMDGRAKFTSGQLNLSADFDLSEYLYNTLALTKMSGDVTARGPVNSLSLDFSGMAKRGAMSDRILEDIELTFDGVLRAPDIAGDFVLASRYGDGPLRSDGKIEVAGNEWAVSDLDGALAELTVAGRASGRGGDVAALRADLTIDGRLDILPAEAISARLRLLDRSVDLDATIKSLRGGPVLAETLSLKASGPRERVTFSADGKGEFQLEGYDRPLEFLATGIADLTGPDLSVQSDSSLEIGSQNFIGTVSAVRESGVWRGRSDIRGLGGHLIANLDRAPMADPPRLTLETKSLRMAEIMALLGRPVVEGQLDGEAVIDATPAQTLEGQANFRIDGLASPGSDSDPISAQLSANLQNESLNLTMKAVEGGLGGEISLSGPVVTSGRPPFAGLIDGTPLKGGADINGQIGPLVELFLPPQTDFSARLQANADFSLPYRPALLRGQARMSAGRFEQGAIGFGLKDMTVDAQLSPDGVTVSTFSATGQKGGSLFGSGRMGLALTEGAVQIEASKLRIIDRREGSMTVSGPLSLSQGEELIKLSGALKVDEGEINLARLPKPGLPTLEVSFGDRADKAEAPRRAATELDVSILSDGRIGLKGRGANASMGLDTRVTGSFDNPIVSGRAEIVRGRFDFLSKRFEFRESVVTIKDDVMQSQLAITAVRETPDLTGIIAITGTLDRPKIRLSSEPVLPEDEVLSRLLFGRSPTQLSTLETARLAAALAQLSGGGGFDLLGSLENAVGLDTLDIGSNANGQTQLTTGKYLSDDVYLEVRSSAEGQPGVAVEWQARKNIAVEAETVPGERQRVSVQWKKDFD